MSSVRIKAMNRFLFCFVIVTVPFLAGDCLAINPHGNKNLVGEQDLSIEASKFPISRETWIKLFKSNFSHDFCDQSQWIQTCYQTEPDNCRSLISEKLQDCTPKNPNTFPIRTPAAAKQIGERVGSCLGSHFQERYPLKNREVDLCYLDIF